MLVHSYGAADSPYKANYAVKSVAWDNSKNDGTAAMVTTPVWSQFVKETVDLMKNGGFRLTNSLVITKM